MPGEASEDSVAPEFAADEQCLFEVETCADSLLQRACCDWHCADDVRHEHGVAECCNRARVRVLDAPRGSLERSGLELEAVPLLVEFCTPSSLYSMYLQCKVRRAMNTC